MTADVDVLKMIAVHEHDIGSFIQRIEELKTKYEQGFSSDDPNAVVLSTVHSSKGLEYDTVYMVDVYDGRFPSSKRDPFSRSKDNANGEQEERRIFYVGITRAENELILINIENKFSAYLKEMFPSEYVYSSEPVLREKAVSYNSSPQKAAAASSVTVISRERPEPAYPHYDAAVKRKREQGQKYIGQERAKLPDHEKTADENYSECYREVCDKFTQQDSPIRDHTGRRWVKCKKCGKIKPAAEFCSYGGKGKINVGLCNSCSGSR